MRLRSFRTSYINLGHEGCARGPCARTRANILSMKNFVDQRGPKFPVVGDVDPPSTYRVRISMWVLYVGTGYVGMYDSQLTLVARRL
jgi:hypothetical protein